MTKKYCTCLLTALVSISGPTWAAESSAPCSGGSCGDNTAISSLLLAAGMYGVTGGAGLDLSLNESAKKFRGVFAEQGQFDGQDITLSYTGSSGRLGFSAGYLYTAPEESGAVLVGLDAPQNSRSLFHEESEKPWYLTFNLSKEFQISESFALGLDSRTMLLAPSLLQKEENDAQALCLSFNLPVSYGGLFTVTPELQWSRSLEAGGNTADNTATAAEKNPNTFYGGMSVSFSY